MTLTRIRMELGRTDGYPEGSTGHGYEFVAPLTLTGHIDGTAWTKVMHRCRVRRFWGNEPDQSGYLRRHGQHGWYFDYRRQDDRDDEPLFKLDMHRLVNGNYISVTEHDGVRRPFKIVLATPVSVGEGV